MNIYICLCSLPKAKRPSKIDFSVWVPKEFRLSKRKAEESKGVRVKGKKHGRVRKNSRRSGKTEGKNRDTFSETFVAIMYSPN